MNQMMRTLTTCAAILLTAQWVGAVRADTVAEMSFGAAAANGSGATVKMESHGSSADGQVKLQGDGTRVTKIELGPTGIGDKWSQALRDGYLEAAEFANYNTLNQVGLATTAPAKHYLYGGDDYGGFGNGEKGTQGGTVYLVVKPDTNWGAATRHGLFGSGAALNLQSVSSVDLYCRNNGTLYLDCGSNVAGKKLIAQANVTTVNWDTSKWYFIAASWQSGQAPVLYVRELSPEGPATSPAAATGKPSTGDAFQATIPEGVNGFPFVRPMAIGARWTDTGGAMGTFDGAGAKIAYFRLDNTYATATEIEAVFTALGAAAK